MFQKNKIIENDIETYFVDSAKKHNILCYKFISPQNAGVPDRILISGGYVVFVELKRPDGKPRKLQEKIISKMRKCGAEVYVIDTKTKVDILFKGLKERRKRTPKIINIDDV